jgi:hypothetical protein
MLLSDIDVIQKQDAVCIRVKKSESIFHRLNHQHVTAFVVVTTAVAAAALKKIKILHNL